MYAFNLQDIAPWVIYNQISEGYHFNDITVRYFRQFKLRVSFYSCKIQWSNISTKLSKSHHSKLLDCARGY